MSHIWQITHNICVYKVEVLYVRPKTLNLINYFFEFLVLLHVIVT